MIGRDRGQTRDALSARGKGVAEFAGHGDRVTVGVAELSAERVERGIEAVESEPKRRRRLNHRFDAPVASRAPLSNARPRCPNR